MSSIGKLMVAIGAVIIVVGLILWLAGDKLSWFGNLPGDIKVEKENFRFYMPLTTMILLSITISLILYLLRKLF